MINSYKKTVLLLLAMIAGALFESAPLFSAEKQGFTAAKVMTIDITSEFIGYTTGYRKNNSAAAEKLHNVIWIYITRDYIGRKKLQATDKEIEELLAYQKKFIKKDKADKRKELKEIRKKLKDPKLVDPGRKKLEERGKLLEDLERYSKYFQSKQEYTKEQKRGLYAPFVETWKLNRALYEQYGSTVTAGKYGQDPTGAKIALYREYEKIGLLKIMDKELEKEFWSLIQPRKKSIIPPEKVDFTPFWKKK